MLTDSEALDFILRETRPLPPRKSGLDEALGLVLAEDVASDVDSPPFDKSLMDGFAVRSLDIAAGRTVLTVVEQVTAGREPARSVGSGEATQIMTGAPMPVGADAVVPVERAEHDASSNRVRILVDTVAAGANVLPRASVLRKGERVFGRGRRLRPQEMGALAELGKHEILVHPRPSVTVLATGDELVPVSQTPGPGQIRNSNETMLVAQIRRAGGRPVPLGVARDEQAELAERVTEGLGCDVLLISGGVSAGKRDLVPAVLEAAGVRQVFHKVDVKPGKPLWFGVLERPEAKTGGSKAAGDRCLVFGLPGNPVSSMVCFELFARTALRRLMGVEPAAPPMLRARLTAAHQSRGERPTYHPAVLETDESGAFVVAPVPWQGSSDLQATAGANAMAVFPAGNRDYRAGDTLDVIAWNSAD
jgi:molybdopterin molybdotransferase